MLFYFINIQIFMFDLIILLYYVLFKDINVQKKNFMKKIFG